MSDQNTEIELTVVPTVPGAELDADVAAFIKTLEGEQRAEDLAPPVEAAAPAPTEGEVTAEALPAPVIPATPEPQSPQSPEIERGLERLVAREVELRGREDRLKGQEAEVQTLTARIKSLEADLTARKSPEELVTALRHSPTEGLRALGLDPDDVIRHALAEKLGDKADPALRERIERAQTLRKIDSLEAQIRAQEQRAAQAQFYDQVAAGAKGYVTSDGISRHAVLSTVAKTAPDRVFSEIMHEITKDASARAAREPNGELMSFERAADLVEARYSEFRKLLVPDSVVAPTQTAPASTPTETPKTLAPGQVPPPQPKVVRPPDKPLAPWLQTVDLTEAGIKAGIEEYRKSETVRK